MEIILQWIFLNLQDLKKKPKYLVVFTVGLDQRKNIDESVKKVIHMSHSIIFIYLFWLFLDIEFQMLMFCGSFLRISKFCFFTMMVEQVNGITLSGQKLQFMLVQENKQNGKDSIHNFEHNTLTPFSEKFKL